MPELPDVSVYVEAIRTRVAGHMLVRTIVKSPFLLRSTAPPITATAGRTVREVRRLGKQIAIGVDGDLWLVLHLMIAGRLHWKTSAPKLGSRNILVAFEFDNGWMWLTEAGTQRRAALRVVEGEAGLQSLNAGGIEPLDASLDAFSAALRSSNHTLKRSLTDPHIFSGIGNAYSDEILHRAQLSPIAMSQKLSAAENRAAVRRHPRDTYRMDRSPARRSGRRISGEGVPRFVPRWPFTAAIGCRARDAAPRSSASAMPATRPITVRNARPAAACSPTALFRG